MGNKLLTPQQERFCLLMAEGSNQSAACRIIGVVPQTATRWMKLGAIKERIRELQMDVTASALQRLKEAAMDNVEVVLRIAKGAGTPGVVSSQLKAAVWALDKVLKTPVEMTADAETRAASEMLRELEQTPDAEILELLERGRDAQP